MNLPPLSLYIHVPWCERKCPYCDFNSHQVRSDFDEPSYVQALLDDLDADITQFGNNVTDREIQTIFIGGGTPSLFSSSSYRTLLDGLTDRLSISTDAEITLEANPGSSEVEKFSGFFNAGINRLSIGVQSYNSEHLTALGRVHNTQEAINAANFAKLAGFDNFNLDLMFGLPKQSIEQATLDLTQAIDLAPTHLSYYQLTIEPNTLFHSRPPVTPDDDELWDMQNALQQILAKENYLQYEVSAYSKANKRCQHNLNYWQFGDYLGIGAGAHSKLSLDNSIIRSWKIKHPATYITRATKLGGQDAVDQQQIPFEFMMNALRLNHGFAIIDFEERTGMPITTIDTLLNRHTEQGLIELSDTHITPTQFGHNMLNIMLQDYLSLELPNQALEHH